MARQSEKCQITITTRITSIATKNKRAPVVAKMIPPSVPRVHMKEKRVPPVNMIMNTHMTGSAGITRLSSA
ncbi:hypothetical protein IH574_04240 [Candidatus Bathyarchaeota archaeon]|nr:hypothetical protein [Candidatus Bathyarchaeota archaeon]